jgi:hypothetical protein
MIGGRTLFQLLANWPGRWPRRLESAAGLGRMDLMPAFFDADGKLLPSAGTHRPPGTPVPVPPEPGAGNELLEQALGYAAINGPQETAAFLIDRGADVSAKPSGFPHRIAGRQAGAIAVIKLAGHTASPATGGHARDAARPRPPQRCA